MSERFFVEQTIRTVRVLLTGDEARHLISVMRARVGDDVTLFDGGGAEFTAKIASIDKREAELEITGRREISRELPRDLTLAVAVPKGERQKWLVEKLTELGVTRLVPLITERGVAQPTPAAQDRLRRGVIEASKQCGRNRLLQIDEPSPAREYFANTAADVTRLVADPSGGPLTAPEHTQPLVCAIGPEGGFSPAELAVARQAGWRLVSLGPRILRVETAAIAASAILAAPPAAV